MVSLHTQYDLLVQQGQVQTARCLRENMTYTLLTWATGAKCDASAHNMIYYFTGAKRKMGFLRKRIGFTTSMGPGTKHDVSAHNHMIYTT